jgi:hypothetical protein
MSAMRAMLYNTPHLVTNLDWPDTRQLFGNESHYTNSNFTNNERCWLGVFDEVCGEILSHEISVSLSYKKTLGIH